MFPYPLRPDGQPGNTSIPGIDGIPEKVWDIGGHGFLSGGLSKRTIKGNY
jgi:hypothetical protein